MGERQIDWLAAIILLLGLSSLYFATTSGITSSNDGSHYALTRSMVENGRFTLSPFDPYAEGNDIAIRGEEFYSDRPPGTALVSTLFYSVGRILPAPFQLLPSKHNPENPALVYLMLLPVLAGTGTILLLYWLMRRLGVMPLAAFLACVMVGVGTTQWKYSTVLFSHVLSGFLIVLSLVALFYLVGRAPDWRGYALLGFAAGLSVLAEYSNGLLVISVGLYLLWQAVNASDRLASLRLILLPFVLGGMVPALFLAYYNNVNFGSPFTLSYAYAINYPWASSFRTTFTFPLWQGVQAMVWWGEGEGWCNGPCWNQGFLLLSPIFWVALAGIRPFWREARQNKRTGYFLLVMGIFLVYLLLFSRHRTFHGFTGDGRYLAPFLPLLALPLAFAWQGMLGEKRPLLQSLFIVLTLTLFAVSLRNNILHIGFSYNYTLDLSQLSPLVAAPTNWRYLVDSLFPNRGNLILLWVVELLLLLPVGYKLFILSKENTPNN